LILTDICRFHFDEPAEFVFLCPFNSVNFGLLATSTNKFNKFNDMIGL